MATVVPLRTYRWAPRKATMTVDGGSVELYLPTYFGSHRWRIPVSEVAVWDADDSHDEDEREGEVIFPAAIVVPYLITTGPATTPTTALLFRTAQRVPPVRALAAWAPNTDVGVGYRESRSDEGAFLDGVMLRFRDPDAPLAALVAAGAERVSNDVAFFGTTPTHVAARTTRRRRPPPDQCDHLAQPDAIRLLRCRSPRELVRRRRSVVDVANDHRWRDRRGRRPGDRPEDGGRGPPR